MTKVMGIVNVTPDSFSDGGKYFRPEEAVKRARNMVEEGADIIDIGAESTRPGATPLSWQEEWARLADVLPDLAKFSTLVSIDTYHPETAERAIAAGAGMINCVYADHAATMLALCREANVSLVLPAKCLPLLQTFKPSNFQTFKPSNPQTFKPSNPQTFKPSNFQTFIDPMIGFGTTREEDLALLKGVRELAKEWPVLVGASRKRIVKKLTGEKMTGKNLGGNLAIAIWCAMSGASIVRVHDVKETVQALKVMGSLMT